VRILNRAVREEQISDNNDPAALYDKFAPALLSLCLRYCGNIQDAEDVLHEGFIKIIRSIHSFENKGKGSLEGWMHRIMVNTALNFIRDHAKERNIIDIEPMSEKIDAEHDDENNTFRDLAEKIDQEVIMEMICELPQGYRTVFNLYVFESNSHREIAELLKCSENTSKSQLSKARALLRKKLTQLLVTKNG
jgi:RNA polymerase sigma-70 factor, ECF subfamily